MWLRCGVDVWHLDCKVGAVMDIAESRVKISEHDYIAAVMKRGEKLEPVSYTHLTLPTNREV